MVDNEEGKGTTLRMEKNKQKRSLLLKSMVQVAKQMVALQQEQIRVEEGKVSKRSPLYT